MNTHDHHDDEPLPGEAELKALYRSLPRKEPPPALDEAVRRAAADAVPRSRVRRMPRWPVAAATAAVLVLAAGLSWRMREQPASFPPAPVPNAATVNAPASAAPAVAPAPHATDQSTSAPTEPARMQAATPIPRIAAPASQPRESIHTALKPRVMTQEPSVRQAASAPAPAPMALAAQESAPAPFAPAAPPAAAQAYAPAPTTASAARAEHGVMTMKAMAAPMQAAPMPAADPTAANPADTPAQELDKIRLLFTQQRRDEALQRITAFRQVHPDLTLPDDLRAQLPDHD